MKHIRICLLFICMIGLSACSAKIEQTRTQRPEEHTKTIFAMDTVMTLTAYGENAEGALNTAEMEIKRLDGALRRGSVDSEIYKVNAEGTAEVSDDTITLIRSALAICRETEGAFDISVAPVMDLWGFYTREFYVPSDAELALALEKVDYRNISIQNNTICTLNGAQIDLGGIAKGFLSNRIMEIYKNCGVTSGLVSLGGNVQTIGKKPDGSDWKIAVENPDGEDYVGILNTSDCAVITSGVYQRYFEQGGTIYHHIIDPATGYPASSGVKSVSIISKDGALADGLSTALFVMGVERGTEYWRTHDGFDAIFVTDSGEIIITDGIADCFESERPYTVFAK